MSFPTSHTPASSSCPNLEQFHLYLRTASAMSTMSYGDDVQGFLASGPAPPAGTETSNLMVCFQQISKGFREHLVCPCQSVTFGWSLGISVDDQPWIYFPVLCCSQRPFLWSASKSKYNCDCFSTISRDHGDATGVQRPGGGCLVCISQ